jgi:hypothetical protein
MHMSKIVPITPSRCERMRDLMFYHRIGPCNSTYRDFLFEKCVFLCDTDDCNALIDVLSMLV